uniref:Cordon-bleu WH2 repeat protein n=1 Tax=Seriola lalandi dorsalis TaxID=1841481 RepID=A0A3B4YEC9_SERLL
ASPGPSTTGRRMKARAPPPPQVPQPAPRHIFRNAVPDGGGTSGMDAKENMLRPTVDLQLTLPQGYQTSVTENGSKALMDLLVELCSRYHLNPALHTLELLSPEGHPLGFKPNALLGSLNVACVLIKEKVWEEKVVRRPAPKVPEKTVRLMVNYHGSQKTVVRVNPLVPLEALTPAICDKCEFDPAHVLLLKDAISCHELPLDKSLAELGIKELYVHDRSLDSIRSSTTSLGRAEKKGFLGIFQFSRRKSKGLASVSSVEDRPSTLGQSQSVMNMSRMSPKSESKKRRAPAPPEAPTPIMGHMSFEGYQMALGSESQQRKRKAPAPPPTPASITPGFDDTSTSPSPTPDSLAIETPTPALRTKVAQSVPASSTIVVMQTMKPAPLKVAIQPATPTASSPTPSSSTTDSLALQDSSSDLSHSLDDSDADLDQTGSYCSTLTSSTVSGSVRVQPATKSSSSRMEESEMSSSTATKLNQEVTSTSSSRSEMESALNLKLDEVENNRHSAMETETPEEETVSLGSSSGGSSLPDQGYAASEGMADGEDSGMVSSPSDTQPTSPDGSLSLDGSSGGGAEKLLGPVRDNSSDSDEGCATWGSRHSSQAKSGGFKDSYEDPELTAQLHQTLADFEADLADHIDIVSVKETPYTMSTDSNEVPVSVVDMDVPVTAIDEVLEDYESNVVENEAKALTRTESSSTKPQNKNNNACTAADSNKSSSANTKQPSQPEQHRESLENKSIGDEKREKITETKIKEMNVTQTESVKEEKQRTTSAVKSNADMQKQSKSTEIKSDPVKNNAQPFQEKKPVLPPTSQRSVSAERVEEGHRVYQNNSSSNTSHGKITRNVTSRFGMKTFTVVPPKPSAVHSAIGDPAVKLIAGAITIDDQGNMVKGISRNKVGGSSESGINCGEGSPLHGRAKLFWSSNERQESPVHHRKGQINKAKENMDVTDIHVAKEDCKPALSPLLLPDLKRDLSFLKPSRRTSSQYVASAITKYAPKTSDKPNSIPKVADSSASVKTQTVGFQRSGRSIQVNPHPSSQSSLADNKENDSASKPNPSGPKRLMSCPEYVSDSQRDFGEARPDTTHLTPDARPQPSVTVSDRGDVPQPVTVFGPLKKFRPVICRSVEKETSLHSSLMDAIQTGGGRDRLKKIYTSGPSNMKKASYVEEENERSALLAAIRAQSNSSRLRKTKSEAADELEKFRKVVSEEERSAHPPSSPSPPSVTSPSTSPPVFTPPPPPPPAPTAAPPPPPPVFPQGKPSAAAMLEAIRSGSAAERLKKVAVPTKTVQVNGRLGTIQATSSALTQQ